MASISGARICCCARSAAVEMTVSSSVMVIPPRSVTPADRRRRISGLYRRPDDVIGDEVTGRLGGGTPVGGDVGGARVVGQLLQHRRREIRWRDDPEVEHDGRRLPEEYSGVEADQALRKSTKAR
jgi:hypothetical protein